LWEGCIINRLSEGKGQQGKKPRVQRRGALKEVLDRFGARKYN
jgi:hypothetical protein